MECITVGDFYFCLRPVCSKGKVIGKCSVCAKNKKTVLWLPPKREPGAAFPEKKQEQQDCFNCRNRKGS